MILGATTLYWFAALLTKWNGFVEDDPIESGRLYTVFTIWLLPEVFALTFRRPWGLWPAAVFVAGGGAVGLAGYLIGGGVWNPVLAAWTYAGDLLVWGALAVSFPVAILARSPGASSGNRAPFVESAMSSISGTARRRRMSCSRFGRIVGSPPVMRIRRNPSGAS